MSISWPPFVCPEDHRALEAERDVLRCAVGHVWNVDGGIPRMIRGPTTYAEAFGLQWKTYRRTQLDSYTHTTLSRDRLRRCLGDECWDLLEAPGPVQVLEIGCGAGRFTEILLSTRAWITAVDYTVAIDANRENFGARERLRHVQADVMRLPVRPGQFDLVLCLGVVQHTPDPEATIAALYEQVKPGGYLVFDHYCHSLSYYTKTAPLVRAVLRRLPPAAGLRWTERLVKTFFPLHKAVGARRIPHALLSRVSPVLSYFHALPLDEQRQREWALLDTHDSLTDWYKHFRSRGQIAATLSRQGAADIHCVVGRGRVEARCRRRPDARPSAGLAGH